MEFPFWKSYKSVYKIIMILKKVQKDKSPENTMDYDASSVTSIWYLASILDFKNLSQPSISVWKMT